MDFLTDLASSYSYDNLLSKKIGSHAVVLLAEGGAPYDDVGLCIVDIPSLKRSRFAARSPDTRRPAGWDKK
jgi:hypothetical protein